MDITCDGLLIRQDGFSLSADLKIEGGSTAIIGPSGGGKSTLLLALAGFLHPLKGRILFDGKDHTRSAPADRPVTLLFQEHNLFPHLNVAQNTALGLRPSLRLNAAESARVSAALNEVGLHGMEDRLPANLSGGQRQRVALARALLRNRPVLLLDEPFAALGPALRHEMLDLVARIRAEQNATLLLVTHTPSDARRITKQAVLVAEGVANPLRETSALLDNPPPALAAYLGET